MRVNPRLQQEWQQLGTDRGFAEILRGSAFAVTAQLFSNAFQLAISIFVARQYGAGPLGALAVIQSFVAMVTIPAVMGTNTSILRLLPQYIANFSFTSAFRLYSKIQRTVALFSLLTGAGFFLCSGWVAHNVFGKPHLEGLFRLAAVFVLFSSLMQLNTEAIRGLRLVRTYALVQAMPTAVMLAALLVLTAVSPIPDNPVYAFLVSLAVTAVAGAVLMHRAFARRMNPDDVVYDARIREIMAVSTPMLLTASMHFLLGQTGIVVLGIFHPEADVGHFAAAVRLSTVTVFVLRAINSMAAPKFSELHHTGQIDELFRLALKSTKFIFWTTTPILFFIILFGDPILGILFGPDFRAAYWPMVVLAAGQFVNSISGSTGTFMNMTSHEKAFRNIVVGAAVLNLGLNLLLVPSRGMMGAAIAATASLVFWNFSTLGFIRWTYGRGIGYGPWLG